MFIFILGNQRSGTTFLYQMLCAHFKVGFINNFMAKFPDNPSRGIEIGKGMGLFTREISFESKYGNTPLLSDPHEFGWFWRRFFNLDAPMADSAINDVPWRELNEILKAMQVDFDGMPLVFKCAGMGFHASDVARAIPGSRFLYIHRRMQDVVEGTLEVMDAEGKWHYGFKPPLPDETANYKVQDRVRAQVRATHHLMEQQVSRIPHDLISRIEYERLRDYPFEQLGQIQDKFGLAPAMVK